MFWILHRETFACGPVGLGPPWDLVWKEEVLAWRCPESEELQAQTVGLREEGLGAQAPQSEGRQDWGGLRLLVPREEGLGAWAPGSEGGGE